MLVPAGHGSCVVDPDTAGVYDPTDTPTHPVAPEEGWKDMAPQRVHTVARYAALNDPGVHG